MKNLLFILLLCCPIYVIAQNTFITTFEKTEGKETATYEQVIDFYQQLSEGFEEITVTEKGLTDSGLPLHLVKVSRGGGDKLRLLINNGIHPGEPDGIDASMMLARDLVQKDHPLLKDFDIYIIPVYNIGGALNRNSTSRVNQQGPEEYGFRGNVRNYDLNRDFIKADTRNTRSFYEVFHEVQPDIFIDTHVSNGADYQHNITHLFTQHDKLYSKTGEFLYEEFIPSMEKAMIEKGDPMTPYVNVFNRTPDTGFSQFMDWPRYSTGYTALFNTLGMMIETHMLKPYEVRVKSTYDFLISAMETGKQHRKQIFQLRNNKEWWPEKGEEYPMDWQLNREEADTIQFLGYEGRMIESGLTGQHRLYYDHEKPFQKAIPYYNHFTPANFIKIPEAYIIPQGWHEVIDLLVKNKAEFTRLKNDSVMNVEVYHIKNYETADRAYEGHYPHSKIEVESSIKQVNFRKGDYIFPVHQKAGRYLIETLEPEAHDSYFGWNYFDTILQRKEGFSPYVFEDLAKELLEKDPQLMEKFKAWKEANEDANAYAQLRFIYENSPYAEEAFGRYPVYRLGGG
ncbi:MAG: M14 family metallopeptidase [Candidatus Cyclobacteriaceae bacterium M2_1C_046]